MGLETNFKAILNVKPDNIEMFKKILSGDIKPNHSFFKTERYDQLLLCGEMKENIVTIDNDFKNYNNEIEEFLDWVNPFIYDLKYSITPLY